MVQEVAVLAAQEAVCSLSLGMPPVCHGWWTDQSIRGFMLQSSWARCSPSPNILSPSLAPSLLCDLGLKFLSE